MTDYRYMNVRTIRPAQQIPPIKVKKQKNQSGFIKLAMILVVMVAIIWALLTVLNTSQANAITSSFPEIRSDAAGYCLDDYLSQVKPGSPIYSYSCNGSQGENWHVVGSHIVNGTKYCMAEINNQTVMEDCTNNKNQNWVVDGVGFRNQANGLCLSLPQGKINKQLITASCNNLTSISESWTPTHWQGESINATSSPACNNKQLGNRVACLAQRQWLAWQTEPKLHNALLYDYTDGNPYEEWCADFVSYIYAEAGAPFTGGERGNGWDEYNANNIQYMGFTYHAANSGYIPKPGDVAYFNYSGGHVEIVVKGGKHPLFIYGDSGTHDPITGNGNMAENHIVSDGLAGHVVYYLSPN